MIQFLANLLGKDVTVRTGSMQFHNDSPGVFLTNKDCEKFFGALQNICLTMEEHDLQNSDSYSQILDLLELLANAPSGTQKTQYMKTFPNAVMSDEDMKRLNSKWG
jgi:hypothetical protein